jgi:hypothetical protein
MKDNPVVIAVDDQYRHIDVRHDIPTGAHNLLAATLHLLIEAPDAKGVATSTADTCAGFVRQLDTSSFSAGGQVTLKCCARPCVGSCR